MHVPYKGGSQGGMSVVSGETDWVLTPAPAAMSLVAGGRLRLLGHSMTTSARPLGDTPAIDGTVPGFEFASWIGLMAASRNSVGSTRWHNALTPLQRTSHMTIRGVGK